jgi:hypothetical protein
VSASDLAKRRELEKYKRNALKNLNMFVSSTRYQREREYWYGLSYFSVLIIGGVSPPELEVTTNQSA